MIDIMKGRYDIPDFHLEIELAIARGRRVAVLGPSGAGKSTLLNIIAGFDRLTAGRLIVDGRNMETVAAAERPVSMVFQDHNAFAHLDAWSNVALGLSPSLKLDDGMKRRIDRALEEVGISHLAKRLPGDMSGGERQRIAIARVLVRERPVLLLDEAFAALGPALRKDMLGQVHALHAAHGLTTLMVTHQPEDARLFADQVVFVSDGLVHAALPVDAFFNSRDAVIRNYLG